MKHTALPWRLNREGNLIMDSKYEHLNLDAAIRYGQKRYAQAKINAAFIVMAVNNHYALLEALQNIVDVVHSNPNWYRSEAARALAAVVGAERGKN